MHTFFAYNISRGCEQGMLKGYMILQVRKRYLYARKKDGCENEVYVFFFKMTNQYFKFEFNC